MNERIKDLARQSGATNTDGGRADSAFCFTENEFETFVQKLIVESALLANRTENSDTETRCMYDVITEHFGIK